jgi:hypothetical protein
MAEENVCRSERTLQARMAFIRAKRQVTGQIEIFTVTRGVIRTLKVVRHHGSGGIEQWRQMEGLPPRGLKGVVLSVDTEICASNVSASAFVHLELRAHHKVVDVFANHAATPTATIRNDLPLRKTLARIICCVGDVT